MLFQRMVIIGPGLIGGSLGLAAKKAGLVGHVVGVGHRQSSLDKAIRMGAIDSGSLAPASALDGADAVVVCTAVGLIPEMIRQVAPGLKPGCIVSDVGSTKSGIVREAEAALPAGVHFVGAHPIAGSERRGVEVATVDLFRGRVCVLTPGAHTDARALAKMKELWAGVGARLFMLSPEEHDVILARTSHLPHAVASALLATLEDKDGPFVGSGFRDTTRIGSGDPDLWADILLSNREAALAALKVFGGKLDELSRALAEGDSAKVRDFLARARDRREKEFSDPA